MMISTPYGETYVSCIVPGCDNDPEEDGDNTSGRAHKCHGCDKYGFCSECYDKYRGNGGTEPHPKSNRVIVDITFCPDCVERIEREGLY